MTPTASLAWLVLANALDALAEQGRDTPCQRDPLPYFDEDPRVRAEAAQACRACAVTDLCAAYSDAAQEPAWVWGGRDRAPGRGHHRRKETAA